VATGARSVAEIARENRRVGDWLQEWARRFLSRIHAEVRVVGGVHVEAHTGPAPVGYDIAADGLLYEVKGCCRTIRRSNVPRGRQAGRWKIDRHHHDALAPELASRTLYLLIVRRGRRLQRAYLASHATLTRIMREHRATSRYVSLPHHVLEPMLREVYRAK
jgi:hypothetical protein